MLLIKLFISVIFICKFLAAVSHTAISLSVLLQHHRRDRKGQQAEEDI
jgi:hypothetical protein